ncbi:hypothetical protein L209DRAFT_748304 [Thermothelomyces heterothallicus CBS 203.75]
MIKAFRPDDWIILVTWVAAAGFAIISIVREWQLPLADMETVSYACSICQYGLLW